MYLSPCQRPFWVSYHLPTEERLSKLIFLYFCINSVYMRLGVVPYVLSITNCWVCLTFTLCISVKNVVQCSRFWSFVRLYFVLVLVLVLDGTLLATRLVTNEPVLSACVMSSQLSCRSQQQQQQQRCSVAADSSISCSCETDIVFSTNIQTDFVDTRNERHSVACRMYNAIRLYVTSVCLSVCL